MKKEEKILLGLIGVGALIGIYALYRKNKNEEKSGFNDDGIKVAQFDLINNTSIQQKINLFDAFGGSSNPNVEVSPSFNFMNNSIRSNPKYVNSFNINVTTKNTSKENGTLTGLTPTIVTLTSNQTSMPITKICQDASGNGSTQVFYPIISEFQFRENIATFNTKDLVLDGNCYLNYTINPNTIVRLTMNYYDKSYIDAIHEQQLRVQQQQNTAQDNKHQVKTKKKKRKFLWFNI